MPDHEIIVKFVNGKVYATPNPAAGIGIKIEPKEKVTWKIDGKIELQLLFLKYREVPGGDFLEPCGSLGPFKEISSKPGEIVGIVRDDVPQQVRFLYNLFYKGEALVWKNPVPNEAILAGGIDIPMTPMEQPAGS